MSTTSTLLNHLPGPQHGYFAWVWSGRLHCMPGANQTWLAGAPSQKKTARSLEADAPVESWHEETQNDIHSFLTHSFTNVYQHPLTAKLCAGHWTKQTLSLTLRSSHPGERDKIPWLRCHEGSTLTEDYRELWGHRGRPSAQLKWLRQRFWWHLNWSLMEEARWMRWRKSARGQANSMCRSTLWKPQLKN